MIKQNAFAFYNADLRTDLRAVLRTALHTFFCLEVNACKAQVIKKCSQIFKIYVSTKIY